MPRTEPRGRREAAAYGVAALALLIALASLFSGLDRISAATPVAERLVPGPFRDRAEMAEAQLALLDKDIAGARAAAVRAIAARPIAADGPSALGATYLIAGDAAGAEAAFRVAAAGGWRDRLTQVFWAQRSADLGEWDLAAARVDAFLRAHPESGEADALIALIDADPAGRRALAGHIAVRPDWITTWLNVPAGAAPQTVAAKVPVLLEARRAGPPLGCVPVQLMIGALIEAARYEDAEAVWRAHCPTATTLTGISDPAFARVDSGEVDPFGWAVARSGDVTIDRIGGAGGLSVLNRASGARLVARQYARIQGTTDNVRWRAVEEDGRPSRRVDVAIDCGSGQRPPLAGASERTIALPDCSMKTVSLWVGPGSGRVSIERVETAQRR